MSSLFYEYGKSGKELKKSLDKQRKYLDEQVAQSLKNQECVKNFKATAGELTAPTKFERPLSEQLADRNFQLNKAFNSVNTIIDDADEARKVIDQMDFQTVQSFNRYAPRIITEVNQNFGNVTAEFLSDFIDQYISRQMEASNLLAFYNPDTITSQMQRDDNFYLDKDGKPQKYNPYVGRVTDAFIMEEYQKTFDNIQGAEAHLIRLDSIRDRLRDELKKLSQKRGPANDVKIAQFKDWMDLIEQGISYQIATIDGLRENVGRFEPSSLFQASTETAPLAPMSTPQMFTPDFNFEGVEIQEGEEEEPFNPFGIGGQGVRMTKSKMRTMVNGRKPVYGRGIALIEPAEKFVPFGKYYINYPHLEDGFIQLRFKSKGVLNDEKLRRNVKISKEMKNLMLDLIEKQKVPKQKFEKLNSEEKDLFKYILEITKLKKQLGFGTQETEDVQDEDEKRFKILIGEMRAGNTNPELKRQLLLLIGKFVTEGRIEKEDGEEIMTQLLL
jgi:hypothetical protein